MAVPIPLGYPRGCPAGGDRMDVVLQQRAPKYGIGWHHSKTAAGHSCIALLLLSTVKNGGITLQRRDVGALGFWPWSTLYERGGTLSATLYATVRRLQR